MTRRIPLRRRDGSVRGYALVDAADFARLGHLRWSMHSQGYAYRWERAADGSRYCQLLHRAIVRLAHGDLREADHQNRDRLDCRRENLRVVPPGANSQNQGARGSSPFRGVFLVGQRWYTRFEHKGVVYSAGTHATELDAARAVDARRREVMPFALPDPELARLEAA